MNSRASPGPGAILALLIVLSVLAPLLASCEGNPAAAPPAPAPVFALRLVAPGGGAGGGPVPTATVEVSSDPSSRERGLMGRDVLPPDTGMLFVYPAPRELHFWMKNCRLPLAAAFLDAEGRILNVAEMAPGAGKPEGELPFHDSAGPATYVLEMEGGWFARRRLGAGDRVDLAEVLRGVVPR